MATPAARLATPAGQDLLSVPPGAPGRVAGRFAFGIVAGPAAEPGRDHRAFAEGGVLHEPFQSALHAAAQLVDRFLRQGPEAAEEEAEEHGDGLEEADGDLGRPALAGLGGPVVQAATVCPRRERRYRARDQRVGVASGGAAGRLGEDRGAAGTDGEHPLQHLVDQATAANDPPEAARDHDLAAFAGLGDAVVVEDPVVLLGPEAADAAHSSAAWAA